MSGLHFHLLLSHVPVLAVILGTILLVAGLWRRNRTVQQVALAILVVSGVAAGAAYLTGEGAEEAIEDQLRNGAALIERHEAAALFSLVLVGVLAVIGAVALLLGRGGRPLPRAMMTLSLVVALVASGTFAWVANLGGQIGHPEIRSQQAARASQQVDHDADGDGDR